jgi:hypothetical protein
MIAQNLKTSKIAQDAPKSAARNPMADFQIDEIATVFCPVATGFKRCGNRVASQKNAA